MPCWQMNSRIHIRIITATSPDADAGNEASIKFISTYLDTSKDLTLLQAVSFARTLCPRKLPFTITTNSCFNNLIHGSYWSALLSRHRCIMTWQLIIKIYHAASLVMLHTCGNTNWLIIAWCKHGAIQHAWQAVLVC